MPGQPIIRRFIPVLRDYQYARRSLMRSRVTWIKEVPICPACWGVARRPKGELFSESLLIVLCKKLYRVRMTQIYIQQWRLLLFSHLLIRFHATFGLANRNCKQSLVDHAPQRRAFDISFDDQQYCIIILATVAISFIWAILALRRNH